MAATASRRHPPDVDRGDSHRTDMRRPDRDSGARDEARTLSSGGRNRQRDVRTSTRNGNGQETTSALLTEIETQTTKLKHALFQSRRALVPWDKSIEKPARNLRTAHVLLLIHHWTHPDAQNIDQLWLTTSYWLITAYRTLIADVERKVGAATAGSGGEGARRPGRRATDGADRERESGPVELRKILQRFQKFLTTEITFYQWLIRKLVVRFDLFGKHVNAGELKGYLAMLHEGLETSDHPSAGDEEAAFPARRASSEEEPHRPDRLTTIDAAPLHLSREETQKKLHLVHKALLCLGDISRYKEQYGPERERKRIERGAGSGRNGKAGPAGGRVKEQEERFERAKRYYAVAKGVLPDNGNPFNQLAVMSVEIGDTFDAIYHYHRALACSQPFKSAGQNLQRSLDKARRDWTAYVEEFRAAHGGVLPVFQLAHGGELEGYKNELVVMQAINGDERLYDDDLLDSHYDHLHHLVIGRILPSAIIVKVVVLAIAADWNTMMAQVPAASNEWYFLNCLSIAYTICYAARDEVASCLDPTTLKAVEAGQVPVTTSDRVDNLSTNITAALRRMLPALRIISKWVKGNVSRLARAQQTGGVQQEEVERFAEAYSDLLGHMGALFPLEQLPKLYDPLEEDHDMKGFSPLKRGMMDKAESDGAANARAPEVHPNEEQLMRISDILLDGKLVLFQAEAKHLFGTAPPETETVDQLANLQLQAPAFVPRNNAEVDSEVASVSTGTEDDPVNMAMRATLGDSSSIEDEDEMFDEEVEEEEQLVWGGRNAPTPPTVMDTPRGNVPATAFDLVNNLVNPAVRRPSQASSPTHRQSFSDQPRPPNRLFGGNFGSIWAPATGEVNALGDVPRSRSGSSAGFPRVQRDAAHSPSPWGTPDLHRTPQQDASNSFGSPTVADFSTKRGDRHGSHGDGNMPFMPFG